MPLSESQVSRICSRRGGDEVGVLGSRWSKRRMGEGGMRLLVMDQKKMRNIFIGAIDFEGGTSSFSLRSILNPAVSLDRPKSSPPPSPQSHKPSPAGAH